MKDKIKKIIILLYNKIWTKIFVAVFFLFFLISSMISIYLLSLSKELPSINELNKFNPEIILHHNTGWGGLSDKYTLYNFKTKEDIYLESGLELARVLKFNYLDLGYITFGAGAFYRYGSYELESFNDNIAFKLNIGFSFN